MYLSKNSIFIFRKTPMFSLDILKSGFKIGLVKLWAKVPEDDPTRPSLRLNIPRDITVSSPYELTSESICNKPHSNSENEKFTVNESDSFPMFYGGEMFGSGNESLKDNLRRTHSNLIMHHDRNSSEMQSDGKFAVKTKSSESLMSVGRAEREEHACSKRKRKFTLKREHITLSNVEYANGELKNVGATMENGITRIKVLLDNSENEELSSIQGNIEEGVNSEEDIRALAEAIVNEVSPKINAGNPEDDAVFVIINVVDQNQQGNSSRVNPKSENEGGFSPKRNESKIKAHDMKQSEVAAENLCHEAQGKLSLNNVPEMKRAENVDSSDTRTDFRLDNYRSSARKATGIRRSAVASYPGMETTEERYEPDITDISFLTNRAKVGSGTSCPSNRTRKVGDWRSLLDELKFKLPAENRAVFRHMGTDNFEMNAQCLNEKYSPKLPSRLMCRGNFYGTGNGIDIGDSFPKNKKDVIINVMKNVLGKTPKSSDNIVNLGNERLAEDGGTTSIDSLSMMKKVKEMLDVDLKNAEEIFMISEEEKTSAACQNTSKEEEPEKQSLQVVETTSDAFSDVPVGITQPATETLFDSMAVCDFDPSRTKSIVIYDDTIGKYYINRSELEFAVQHQNRELKSTVTYDGNSFKADENHLKFKGNLSSCTEIRTEQGVGEKSYVVKKGDSVIFFNDITKKWEMDFNVINSNASGMEKQQSETENVRSVGNSMDERKLSRNSLAMNSKKGNDTRESAQEKISENASSATEEGKKMEKREPSKGEEGGGYAPGKLKRNQKNAEAREMRGKSSHPRGILTEIKKPDSNVEEDVSAGKESGNDFGASKAGTGCEVGTGSEKDVKKPRYLSENVAQLSQNVSNDKKAKLTANKYETVKLNISPGTRPPSSVTEVNVNETTDDGNNFARVRKSYSESKGESTQKKMERQKASTSFYEKFERYKSPFSDPGYEEESLKINSDLKSNPNLKKLESCNKTLVLQDASKLPENIEYWLKDDADKMATLLLKVLQEAAEESNKRNCSSECRNKGNPYETIRKKQEDIAGRMKAAMGEASRRKDSSRKKSGIESQPSYQSAKYVKAPTTAEGIGMIRGGNGTGDREKSAGKAMFRKRIFPMAEDEMRIDVVSSNAFLPEGTSVESPSSQTVLLKAGETEDIPGPSLLKRFASVWQCLPVLGCQMTIFFLISVFHMVKLGSSMLTVNTHRTKNDPFGGLFAKYGPVVKLQSPLSGDIVLINRPRDIASVFAMEQTPARSIFDSAEKCRIWVRQKKFPTGTEQMCAGIEWDSLRKSTADVSREGCETYFNSLCCAASLLSDRIRSVRNSHNQLPEDFITEIKKWSLEGMCSVLFDRPLQYLGGNNQSKGISESEHLLRHLEEASQHLCKCESHFQSWRFFNTPAMVGLSNAYRSLDIIMSKYIHQAEINLRQKRKYLATKKKFDSNLSFIESMLIKDRTTPENLASNLIDMLIVGFNTTSIAFGFLLYHLSQNSKVQNHLFKEVKELLPEKTSALNYHQMHSLKYLQACLKETLRMNTPIPFQLKVILNDIALSRYWIPYGTHVVMDFQTACMRAQNFEEPDKFKPERWLDQGHNHTFAAIPFCHGPRSGFVKKLAEVQLWTCIAKIVRNYEIEYHLEEIKSSKNMISYPDKPLKMIFNEREE